MVLESAVITHNVTQAYDVIAAAFIGQPEERLKDSDVFVNVGYNSDLHIFACVSGVAG
jgi:hypothetical protein